MLFELIQIAIGKRERLSRVLSDGEWERLYEEAARQALVGVAFEGVQRLPKEQWPPQALVFRWLGISEQIKRRNTVFSHRCKELIEKMSSAGLHPTILKGQGLACYYSEALQGYRQPGDIDVYVSDGREKSIDFAKSIGQKDISWDYKHLHLQVWDDTEVELHYHVEILLNLWKNRKLQRWFKENETWLYSEKDGLITPTIEMNLFYVLLHIYRHFFTEGVGLRQLMDYYFVLLAAKDVHPVYAEGKSLEDVLRMLGMWKFTKGIMWVMQEVFALDREYLYCEPSENEGRFILDAVLEGGNFGQTNHTDVKGIGKMNTLLSVAKHNLQIMQRYPSEALLSPLWYVWHKCWKMKHQ